MRRKARKTRRKAQNKQQEAMSTFDQLAKSRSQYTPPDKADSFWRSSIYKRAAYRFKTSQKETDALAFLRDVLYCIGLLEDGLSAPLRFTTFEDGGKLYIIAFGGSRLLTLLQDLLPTANAVPPAKQDELAAKVWPKPYRPAKRV